MLTSALQEQINQQIWRQYPEMRGIRPAVSSSGAQDRQSSEQKPGFKLQSPAYTLTYKVNVSIPGGKTLNRWVRVALDANGAILKISTSK